MRKGIPHREFNKWFRNTHKQVPYTLHSVNGEKPGGIRAITDKQEVGSNP